MKRPIPPAIAYPLIHDDVIAGEFNDILDLNNIFDPLISVSGSVPAGAITTLAGDPITTLAGDYITVI